MHAEAPPKLEPIVILLSQLPHTRLPVLPVSVDPAPISVPNEMCIHWAPVW